MTIRLFAQGNRATSITTLAVVALAAVLSAPPQARAADGRPTPVLAQGAGMGVHPSAQVRVVQHALQRRGYDLGPPGVDGRFGPQTNEAVRQMQADYGLAVDGIVGRDTRRALRLTRRSLGETRAEPRRRHAAYRPAAMRKQTSTRQPVAAVTTPRNAVVEFHYHDVSWSHTVLAGALGGLMMLVIAIGVGNTRRRRRRADAAGSGPAPPVAGWIAARNGDEPARRDTVQLFRGADAGAVVSASPPVVDSPRSCLAPGHRMMGYVTVPTGVGGDDGSSAAIEAMCERSGWQLLEIVRDRDVGPTRERPALDRALERIAQGQADGLIVSDLKRLSHSIVDLGALMAWFRNANAALIALDLDIDTSTPRGHRVASTFITLSQHAHGRIAPRNGNGLAELGGNGRTRRPAVRDDPELRERVAAMRAAGMTLQAIADQLNAEAVPTLRGGRTWRPSSIQTALGYRRPRPREHVPSVEHTGVGP